MPKGVPHEKREAYMDAYAEVARRFELDRHQRTALDESPAYSAIMDAGVEGEFDYVGHLLRNEGII